ncbi:MAG: hypothetical protein PHW63_06245 [Alphaproteobacteria bacterium]|nr:hypothetical protein [Alphaproteobacteria bacterium]
MSMPSNLFATAFRQRKLGFMFSLMMAIMIYLGSLAMAAQATLARTSVAWGGDLENRLTIEVPAHPDEVGPARMERAEKIVQALKGMDAVVSVDLLDEAKAADLVKPWVEDASLLESLPLPVLIDVNLKQAGSVSPEGLAARLGALAEGALVHPHAVWMAKLMGFLRGLGYLAGVMLVLTGLSVVVIIAFVCRAAMAMQHDTIELLHFLGATDRSIAWQFQKHVGRLMFFASLVGFFLACLTVAALVWLLTALGGFSLIASATWATVGAVMFLVPLGGIFLALVTARVSVLKLLERLP